MSINLLDRIRDDRAVKAGGFTGSVFLTYSLNLTFFEQIILPALNHAGCANTMILADPDGYSGAIEMGKENIQEAGLKYICSPIERMGSGIQHAKLLLMAGKNHGRLLLGSGNLTHHGFGRNLELYSYYEYDVESQDIQNRYVFTEIWKLLESIKSHELISRYAQKQLEQIGNDAKWLQEPMSAPGHFKVWHNFQEPIFDQFLKWREEDELETETTSSLHIVSPYYDARGKTVKHIVDTLSPNEIFLYLSPSASNMDGNEFLEDWDQKARLKTNKINAESIESNRGKRSLHAKALIGKEEDLAWCISGSTNISYRALRSSWQDDGNLEMVTFQWSPDLEAFDYLLNDPKLNIQEIDLNEVRSVEQEPSERIFHLSSPNLLKDLSYSSEHLHGTVAENISITHQNGKLEFLKKEKEIPVDINADGTFEVLIDFKLSQAEAARVMVDGKVSEYRWIDQPDKLEHYGTRTFHTRVKGQIETFDGAKSLFIELMDYLWERVDLSEEDRDTDAPRRPTRVRKKPDPDETPSEDYDVPDVEDFFTEEELVESVKWGVDQQKHYDRSLMSLRDLLSITLLRLTTETTEEPTGNEDGKPDEGDDGTTKESQEKKKSILDSLRKYLLGYGKKYSKKITEEDFLLEITPKVLFQNHYTLGRVVIEFFNKIEQFTQDDVYTCFWHMWGPLVSPQYVDLSRKAVFDILLDYYPEKTFSAWEENNLSDLFIIMTIHALGDPPEWKAGIYLKDKVNKFLLVKELIHQVIEKLPLDDFKIDQNTHLEMYGIQDVYSLTKSQLTDETEKITVINRKFKDIRNYKAPAKERLSPLLEYQKMLKDSSLSSKKKEQFRQSIIEKGLEKELDLVQRHQGEFYETTEGDDYCPRCGGKLTLAARNKLKKGKLVPCSSCKKALIYQTPAMPEAAL